MAVLLPEEQRQWIRGNPPADRMGTLAQWLTIIMTVAILSWIIRGIR